MGELAGFVCPNSVSVHLLFRVCLHASDYVRWLQVFMRDEVFQYIATLMPGSRVKRSTKGKELFRSPLCRVVGVYLEV